MNVYWNVIQVEVINGPHKGKQGAVVSVIRDQNKVIVENINMVSDHVLQSNQCGVTLVMVE